MSKIVYHIHLTSSVYANKGITKGFAANGWQVEVVDYTQVKRVLGINRMRDKMLIEINRIKPDLVFAQIHTEGIIDEGFCDEVMRVCPMVIVNIDARFPEQMKWLYSLNKHVSLVGYSNGNDIEQCKAIGIENCFVFQSSCDTDEYKFYPETYPRETIPEIVFIGNKTTKYPLSAQRTEMVESLQKHFGSRFGVYGMGWQNREGFARPEREREIYSWCRIAICHNHFDYPEYESDRKYRAAFCGAYPLTFDGAKTTIPEFIEKIGWLLTTHARTSELWRFKQELPFFIENNSYAARLKEVELLLEESLGQKLVDSFLDESAAFIKDAEKYQLK